MALIMTLIQMTQQYLFPSQKPSLGPWPIKSTVWRFHLGASKEPAHLPRLTSHHTVPCIHADLSMPQTFSCSRAFVYLVPSACTIHTLLYLANSYYFCRSSLSGHCLFLQEAFSLSPDISHETMYHPFKALITIKILTLFAWLFI